MLWGGHHFCSLVDHDLEQQLPVKTYTADKGYVDGNNHFYLQQRGLHSSIRLKDNRIEKRTPRKRCG